MLKNSLCTFLLSGVSLERSGYTWGFTPNSRDLFHELSTRGLTSGMPCPRIKVSQSRYVVGFITTVPVFFQVNYIILQPEFTHCKDFFSFLHKLSVSSHGMTQGSQREPASLGTAREQRARATRRLRMSAPKKRTDAASAGSLVNCICLSLVN